ncbi:MAG: ribonuclease R [Acetobacteraceae bacterium]|nr:ribonuclease R [Acetobacteraceae bacterium]
MAREPGRLPSREEIRAFIAASPGRVGKREIAREFKIGPELKAELRDLLKDLKQEGSIAPAGHRRFTPPGRLPDATVVRITGTDPDGDAVARPVEWDGDGPPPIIYMRPERRDQPALAPGERVLARLKPIGSGKYEGRTLRRVGDEPGRILGVFRPTPGGGGRVQPTDRRAKAEWRIPPGEEGGAEADEIVVATPLPHGGLGLKPARIAERLGRMGDARSVSLICIHAYDIPQNFSEQALADAARASAVSLGTREDLRAVPLVTIDGEDARDFDDAVFAAPEGDGFRLLVAIADVAHYVRPGSALDRAARLRGNSVYFPDRVVPMLPEALSNGWCSLRPGEDRGCLFAEMRIDAQGRKLSHRFGRGLMRSAARLTYTQVQEAYDHGDTLALGDNLPHLYAAFRALAAAREERGTLDLDLPERQVILHEGKVEEVWPRPRYDSHRLIEEFMILANVAAAEELERLHVPCMYRVHAPPSEEKLEALRTMLHGMGLGLPAGNQIHPRDLERLLRRVAGTDEALLVNEVVLRAQSQAEYNPDNIGHFGLALPRYAHFTSPIRRYADLLVHRALISALKLGLGGLGPEEAASFADTAEHISDTERRAATAEREAIDRYLAAFMADKVGASFTARISGVQRFGLFVTLPENGASGLAPMNLLPQDYWVYDESSQSLAGRRTRMTYRLMQEVEVRLIEASPLTGGMIFQVLEPPRPGPRARRR